MLLKENNRFIKLFKEYITKVTTSVSTTYGGYYNGSSGNVYSGYNSGSSGPSSNTIYFYELSNLQNKARIFNSYSELVKFCKQYNITLCDHHEKMIKSSYYTYATCIPNTNVLMVRNTFYELSNSLSSYIKNPIGSSSKV